MAIRKVTDDISLTSVAPLRVTTRQAHDGTPRKDGSKSRMRPRDLVGCGDCKERLEIYYEETPIGDPHEDTLEINGVYGTVHQWRQVLLPHLQMSMPDEEVRGPALLNDGIADVEGP
jgi:hypothetical protein